MAEFVEVTKQFNRLCGSTSCPECPLEGHCWWDRACSAPDEFEKLVMDWAKEHPEPEYPTWYEWLKEQGILYTEDLAPISDKGFEPIPADIVEKLGIKPKEAKHD